MSTPEISVIITMYREGPLIKETIESILNQTFSDYEIIVVDNNADSETCEYANEYVKNFPQKIRITKETTQGIASAKNKGIRESRGNFIVFHDGDDVSHKERLEIQYREIMKRPELSFVGSWYDLVSPDNTVVLKKNESETLPTFWVEVEEIFNTYYTQVFRREKNFPVKFPLISSCLFRKKAVLEAGFHDERLNPRWYEENEFLLRTLGVGDGWVIPSSLISYRKHSVQGAQIMKNQMNWINKIRHLNIFFQILKERYGSHPETNQLLNEIRSTFLRYASQFFLQHPSGSNLGRLLLKRAVQYVPSDPKTRKLLLKSYFPKFFYPRIFWFDAWMTGEIPKEVNAQFVLDLFQ